MLDHGYTLPAPDDVLINGHAPLGAIFTVEKGMLNESITSKLDFNTLLRS